MHGLVDRYLANSEAVATASRVAAAGRPVQVVSSFVADEVIDEGASIPRPKFLPAGDGFILFVGTLSRHKGLHALLEAYARLEKSPPLVLIGARHKTTPENLPTGTVMVSESSHEEVMAAWRHCGIAVVPSLWPEPFGLVAVEAMASGRPVVASDMGGLSEIVENGVTGLLVPPGDPAALATAMKRLIDDPKLAADLGAAGRERARMFMATTFADRLERVYGEVLAGVPPASLSVRAPAIRGAGP
jgi:glycosyltransferase involved in cell wall biosynthesis